MNQPMVIVSIQMEGRSSIQRVKGSILELISIFYNSILSVIKQSFNWNYRLPFEIC